jgi:hypothetical protein
MRRFFDSFEPGTAGVFAELGLLEKEHGAKR